MLEMPIWMLTRGQQAVRCWGLTFAQGLEQEVLVGLELVDSLAMVNELFYGVDRLLEKCHPTALSSS